MEEARILSELVIERRATGLEALSKNSISPPYVEDTDSTEEEDDDDDEEEGKIKEKEA
ncbi:uncharacterized protein THITE_2111570 [Thermothielavioides terrestris NRRL 8126]|uniref:Uncharacterized protein n=1 Tax=Thermothielavioides terrestris (strain ATCC 38088 / NRRL 8126) TaxID=578455 RepID=G2R2S8_THETT|nr:uncharacterized protein THITE_2111570 [Thermothielavioides terrestris NRRL 8126]AEO65039.1 hypothetical protein THITE_2111570 [Thermothielavioides terrestris NRRL 8126]